MGAKDVLKSRFSTDYKNYYSVQIFNDMGFSRYQCNKCGNFFWSLVEGDVCPSPPCTNYGFIGNNITKKMSYTQTWRAIEKFFVKHGHTSIKSYPAVCRWFPGLYFTIASIVAFQRTSGGKTSFEFPANPLIIPQSCMRFNDIPNVGVTGRHFTNFVMIGQHAFEQGGYWKDRCVELDFMLLRDAFKIKPEEISFIEDVWVGPNAFGYSLEYFVRGLELGNAVFTEFLGTPENYSTMKPRVVDMGAGLERFAWITQGTPTCYDAVFGSVMKPLLKMVDYDKNLFEQYAKLASCLNLDEIPDIHDAKQGIAKELGIDLDELISTTKPVEALYAITEHAKTLLIAISDGALPSNVGGGYNLRVILRRALGFIDEFEFPIELAKLCERHAKHLKTLYPHLEEGIDDVAKILNVETKRFVQTKQSSRSIIEDMIKKKTEFTVPVLTQLYESQGITPELIEEISIRNNIPIRIPENFYPKLAESHMTEKQKKEKIYDVAGLQKTEILYYMNKMDFSAKVLKIYDNIVILDRSGFYPESGGQECDHGYMNGCKVFDVQKQENVVVHRLENITFVEGDVVECAVDQIRRKQLMQHHSGIHVINGSVKKILGMHIWQAGAHKSFEKAHIDVTHYQAVTDEEIDAIEDLANQIVKSKIKTKKMVISRTEAEHSYGMTLYQGGIVPETSLRVIEVPGHDTEACGGTHVDNTDEIGRIYITSSERIQDGIIRINIVAGRAAEEWIVKKQALLKEVEGILGVKGSDVIDAGKNLFEEWKKKRKEIEKRNMEIDVSDFEIENNVIISSVDGADRKKLQIISKKLCTDSKRVVILFGVEDKINVFASAGKDSNINVGEVVTRMCKDLGGNGGGTQTIAQGYGIDKEKLDEVIKKLKESIKGV